MTISEARQIERREMSKVWKSLGVIFCGVAVGVAATIATDSEAVAGGLAMYVLVGVAVMIYSLTRNWQEWETARTIIREYDRSSVRTRLGLTQGTNTAPVIEDERWAPVSTLLARVQTLAVSDARLVELVPRLEQRLRDLFVDVGTIADAIEADERLGEEPSARLVAIQEQKQAQIDALIGDLRELHVELAAREAHADDSLEQSLRDLLLRLEAEAELEGHADVADEERNAAAKRARLTQ